MTSSSLFQTLKSRYQEALSGKEPITRKIKVAEFIIQMSFADLNLVAVFFSAFEHVSYHGNHPAHLNLYFCHGQLTSTRLNFAWAVSDKDHLGLVSSLTDDRFFTLQQPGSDAIYMLDTQNNEGCYWIPSLSYIPWWESDFPLRMIFHWWLKNSSYQPVHAAAVGTQHGGVLLIGKGGSGKSTSALYCVNSALKLAGDDYVLLDCDNNNAYSLFSLTKVNHQSLQLLRNLNLADHQLGRFVEGKFRIMLYPDFKESLIEKIPILAVLLPQVTDFDQTQIQPCGNGEVMRALAPTTLFQLPGLRNEAFEKMARFVRNIKGYHLLLGKDSAALPTLLKDFIQGLIKDSL